MIKTAAAVNLVDTEKIQLKHCQAEECPMCHSSIIAIEVSCALCAKDLNNGTGYFSVMNYCPKCQHCFITEEEAMLSSHGSVCVYYETCQVLSSEPVRFTPHTFNDKISALSPQFVEIYNQAKCAETQQLSHIAGMGYRKALEFLVKDYIIHSHPDDEEKVKKMFLGPCITTYIDNHRIKTLAQRAVWIGNDETHYVRDHANKEVEDLKRFISACVSYMDIELTYEEAEAIEKA